MTKAFGSPDEIGLEAMQAVRIIESVVGNAWAANAAGEIVCVSPAVLSRLALTLEEFGSQSDGGPLGWRRMIHPDDYERSIALWRSCLETGQHFSIEHRTLRASGAYGWSRTSAQPLRNGDDHVLGWYGAIIDIETSADAARFADMAEQAVQELRLALTRTGVSVNTLQIDVQPWTAPAPGVKRRRVQRLFRGETQ